MARTIAAEATTAGRPLEAMAPVRHRTPEATMKKDARLLIVGARQSHSHACRSVSVLQRPDFGRGTSSAGFRSKKP